MNQQQLVVVVLAYIISCISLICTIINLCLIRIMKKWNGYLAIITAMCYCQIIYDITFALHISVDDNSTEVAIWNAFQFFGGISVSIWTNILAVVVLRVVVSMQSTDILKNFYWLAAIALIPSLLISIILLLVQLLGKRDRLHDIAEIYYWTRLASIAVNFAIHGIVSYRSYKMKSAKTWTRRTPQEIAIHILSQRMIYYPLMQAISRLGASWYEAQFGFGPYTGHTSNYQFGVACLYVGLSPATGIGYLIVFVLMQPYALEQFKSLILTGKAVDPKELYKNNKTTRRTSFLNRSTLISGMTGSDMGGNSSLTNPSDLNNHVSSLTVPDPQATTEEDKEFYYMDDDELVETIHRAEQRSTFHYPSRDRGVSTANNTVMTFTTNPVNSSVVSENTNKTDPFDRNSKYDRAVREGDIFDGQL